MKRFLILDLLLYCNTALADSTQQAVQSAQTVVRHQELWHQRIAETYQRGKAA
jgi:hypothetical protein